MTVVTVLRLNIWAPFPVDVRAALPRRRTPTVAGCPQWSRAARRRQVGNLFSVGRLYACKADAKLDHQ